MFAPGSRRHALAAALLAAVTLGCGRPPPDAYHQHQAAQRAVSDLRVRFARASDATDRAVMADTDEGSVEYARAAESERSSVRHDLDVLAPLFRDLRYPREARALDAFRARFAEYEALDREILALAVENTNLKAQRLSYGPLRDAADAVLRALDDVARAPRPPSECAPGVLAARAQLAVQAIQVLDGPHIAEADEAVMARMEAEMADHEATVRHALRELGAPATRPSVDVAAAAFERFLEIQSRVIALSRRNTNVRSLALSLGQKRRLTAAGEDAIDALSNLVASEGFRATR